jgi:ABC-type dipeptide/oligopeptide/nickel transport system ATPase component
MSGPPVIAVDGVTKHFPGRVGWFAAKAGSIKAVDGVGFDIQPGRTFGLVSESGCGKSTLAMLLVKLTEPTAGRISLDGESISGLSSRAGGDDDRLRPGAGTGGRYLPPLRNQRCCRACATRRKDPSGHCRIIHLTSEWAFDMATTIKINGVDQTDAAPALAQTGSISRLRFLQKSSRSRRAATVARRLRSSGAGRAVQAARAPIVRRVWACGKAQNCRGEARSAERPLKQMVAGLTAASVR